jgi:hypothetical protein
MLPILIPQAVDWAELQQARILLSGRMLDNRELAIARNAGVAHPELIRIAEVSDIPLPKTPELHQAAISTGLIGPGTIGMTFGYGIYLLYGHATSRLLSHEFRHVHQYEKTGTIEDFLRRYLQQIAFFGYERAPLEIDARQHEIQ